MHIAFVLQLVRVRMIAVAVNFEKTQKQPEKSLFWLKKTPSFQINHAEVLIASPTNMSVI